MGANAPLAVAVGFALLVLGIAVVVVLAVLALRQDADFEGEIKAPWLFSINIRINKPKSGSHSEDSTT